MSRRPLLALASLVALLLVAGCSSETPTPDATSDWSDSPLNRYMSAVWGTNVDEEEAQQQNARVEELIAECMNDQGFEYTPQTMTYVDSGTEWKPDDREWVSQYGYGAIDWPGREEQEQSFDENSDPNFEYLSTLSESETTAYYEVLNGAQPTEEELAANDGMWTPTWEEQGCYGAASHEVRGDDATQNPEHKPIMDAINDFYTKQPENPDLADIDAEWAECMAGAGHGGLARPADASQSIYDRLNEFYETQTEYVENPPELDAIKDDEIELALADLDCREETDYRTKSLTVQWAAEEQFIADHKAELDALVADAEQARPTP